MTTWLSTEDVIAHLQVSRRILLALVPAPVERPAWVLYAGRHGERTARYRWRADRVDDWFEEANRWRVSTSEASPGSCDGATTTDETDRSPSLPSVVPSVSRSRSKTRSTGPAGMTLVELAARLAPR
jgi:hypothetical protein